MNFAIISVSANQTVIQTIITVMLDNLKYKLVFYNWTSILQDIIIAVNPYRMRIPWMIKEKAAFSGLATAQAELELRSSK